MLKAIGTLVVIGFVVVVVAAASVGRKVEDGISRDVAEDMVEQYELAKSHGDKIDRCVRAGLVAESYLQAKDESKYAEWKDVERADCKRAGLRR